jgi:multidrug resistance efflux pump
MQIEFEAVRTLLVLGVILFAGYKAFKALHNWVIGTQEHIKRVEDQIAKANVQLVDLNAKLTTYENLVKKLTLWDNKLAPQVKEAVQAINPMDVAKTGLSVMASLAGAVAQSRSYSGGSASSATGSGNGTSESKPDDGKTDNPTPSSADR